MRFVTTQTTERINIHTPLITTHIHPLAHNMKINVILIPLLLLACDEIIISEAVVLPNFYPFGQNEGDQLLPKNDDESSGPVPISVPFPYFDKYHNSLFVSMQFYLHV